MAAKAKQFTALQLNSLKKSKRANNIQNLETVFGRLKKVLSPYAKYMTIKDDTASEYTLVASFKQNPAKRFGGVSIRAKYVTFYSCPEILKSASPALKKRMQGKASLSFTEIDDASILELQRLTASRFKNFQAGSW